MSYALTALAWRVRLPGTQKLVLLALAETAGEDGSGFLLMSTMVERCGLGDRTVQGALRSLESIGLVRRTYRAGRSTLFHVVLVPGEVIHIPQQPHPRRCRTPADAAPLGAQNMHPAEYVPPQMPRQTPADAAPTPADAAPITGVLTGPVTEFIPGFASLTPAQAAAVPVDNSMQEQPTAEPPVTVVLPVPLPAANDDPPDEPDDPDILSPKSMLIRDLLFRLGSTPATERSCRSFIGKLRREHGDDIVRKATDKAARTKPAEPREWLSKACAEIAAETAPPAAYVVPTAAETVAKNRADEEHFRQQDPATLAVAVAAARAFAESKKRGLIS